MKIVLCTIVLGLGVGATPVLAQESAQPAIPTSVAQTGDDAAGSDMGGAYAALQEVIVTAQKFPQRAFDVPMSLAVIGGPELSRMNLTGFDELQAVVPGLAIKDTGFNMQLAIRGVSNLAGTGALVGQYIDEADVTSDDIFALNMPLYDLGHVEVLRGPQGTLYGEGSLGGTIRYITNKPDLNSVQLSADAQATFDQYGAPGHQLIAVVNAPIVPHELGLRIAADLNHNGGWVDEPAIGLKNINASDINDVRVEGLWAPTERLAVKAMQVIHRGTIGAPVGENANGDYVQVFNQSTVPGLQDFYNLTNLEMSYDMKGAVITNSATYLKHSSDQKNVGIVIPIFPPPAPPFNEYYNDAEVDEQVSSDELRISSKEGTAWQWTLGGFYRHYAQRYLPFTYYFGLPGPLPTPFTSSQSARSKSESAFADTSYQVFDRLTVGGGVRYFSDDERFIGSGATVAQAQTGTFTSVDPRIYLRYRVSKSINVYASAAKGFRSGGFNSFGQPAYGPESVWTYEIGSKLRSANHRLSADADVYFSNYSGFQILGLLPPPAPPLDITRNAGSARVKGVEVDITWFPVDDWKIGINGDYTNARFVKVDVIQSAYQVGDPLDAVARYQVSASAERDFRWETRPAFVRIDYSQTAPETFRNRSVGSFFYSESDHIYVLNVNSGIQWNGNLSLGVFVENVLNDRGYTTPESIEAEGRRAQPRTFGVDFKMSAY